MKILLGVGITVLVFMSYMLAEQRGWVNTNIAERILRGVEDGKAIREKQSEQSANEQKDSVKNVPAETDSAPVSKAQSTETPAPAPVPAKPAEPEPAAEADSGSDDFDSDGFDSDDGANSDSASDDSDDFSDSSEEQPEDAPEKAAEKTPEKPLAKSTKPKKLDYSEVARKRDAWPKAVQMRIKGTKIPMLNKNGVKIGEIEVPVGTRLFVRKVTDRGVLEVKSAVNGQIFQVHASRTTFSRLYTGKPISAGLKASSSASSGDSASSDDFGDSEDSTSSDDSDSGDDSDDDFSDDDFFDDDF